jgi:hypothetical protein
VNERLQQFINWASSKLAAPTLDEALIELVLGKPSPNRAAHLTIETDQLIGRLIYWEDGSAHGQILQIADDPPTDDWHWETVDAEQFGSTFEPFTDRFFRRGVAA